jgi:hypothetical protein
VSNNRNRLIDQIATSNPFFHKMLKGGFYEEADGGTKFDEELMYALAPADSFDGYDELPSTPTDGITKAEYEWRSIASPISYSGKEARQNRNSPMKLVKNRIRQSELGIQEFWGTAFMQGSGNGALVTPKVSAANGSSSINPLPLLVHFTPSSSVVIGNLNQATYTWWRNQTFTCDATTYEGFLFQFDHAYNTCALGMGGPPDMIIVDQITYELIVHAYFQKYRKAMDSEPNFPFENSKFKKALLVMDEKTPDVYTGVTSAATYGTAYFLNTEFLRVRYDPQQNWEMLKDENGKTFQKPAKQDARLGHIAWSGNTTTNQRRKQGVMGKIPRTLT